MKWSQPRYGIDVSHHNGKVAWPKVATTRAFAWVKASEGVGYQDPKFASNAAGATAAGVPWGPYHYARPDSETRRGKAVLQDAAREALHFASVVRGTGWTLPPVLDFEHAKPRPSAAGLSRAQTLAWLLKWAEVATRELGRRPVLYTTYSYLVSTVGAGAVPKLRKAFAGLWQARYPGGPSNPAQKTKPRPVPGWPWAVWQYTSKGTTPGVSGRVDLNVTDAPTLARMVRAQRAVRTPGRRGPTPDGVRSSGRRSRSTRVEPQALQSLNPWAVVAASLVGAWLAANG